MVDQTVIGVDVGGSKTRLQVRRGLRVELDHTVPSDGILVGSYAERARALTDLITEVVGAESTFTALAVGAHGCDTAEQCLRLHKELSSRLQVPVLVTNDAELVLPAAGLSTGIAVIAGTGSIAAGYSDQGELLVAGGWGWILGDEGGAAGLVREAARAVLARADRGAPPDALTQRIEQAFEIDDSSYLSVAMVRRGGARHWGQYAHEVFRAADEGAESARRVIKEAGASLAALVATLHERGADASHVVAAGGVITAQPRLQQAFRCALGRVLPDSVFAVLDDPPVAGATKLAAGLLTRPSAPQDDTPPAMTAREERRPQV